MKFIKVPSPEIFPLFVLISIVLQLLSLIWQVANTLAIYRESSKETPTLVQLVDGRAVRVTPMGSKERSPETIKRFVSETLTLMFNWSGKLPVSDSDSELTQQKLAPDLGKKIGSTRNPITTASWQAGFALSEDFRTSFLSKIADMTPKDVFTGNTQVVLIVRYLSEPELIETGRWKVQVIGDLIFFNSQSYAGDSISFNKEVFIQAVTVPVMPLADKASVLEKTIYRIRQAGLEIYGLRELERKLMTKPNGNDNENTDGQATERDYEINPSRLASLVGFEEESTSERSAETTVADLVASDGALDPRDNHSPRPLWGKPFNKLGLVLGSTSILVLVAYLFLDSLSKPLQQAQSSKLQEFPAPAIEEKPKNETGSLKAEVALGDQAEAFKKLNEQKNQPTVPVKPNPPTKKTSTRPSAVANVTRPMERPPRPISSPPRQIPRTLPVTHPELRRSPEIKVVQPEPQQQWLAAAQLGSYGQLPVVEKVSASSEMASKAGGVQGAGGAGGAGGTQGAGGEKRAGGAGGAEGDCSVRLSVCTSSPASPVPPSLFSSPAPPASPVVPKAGGVQETVPQVPVVNSAQEAPILQEQPLMFVSTGTIATAILTTPVIWDETVGETLNDRFTIVLAQPLLAADGTVALPAKSQLITSLRSLKETGLIRLVAVAAIFNLHGVLTEITLPKDAFQIRGALGKPLLAQQLHDESRTLGADMGRVLFGAVEKGAEIFNSPESESFVTNGGGFSSTTRSRDPNLLAGILSGGAQAIKDELSERNQLAIEAIEQHPNIRFLPAGTVVEVFVNQPTALDINRS